jgi:outer membrane scaffolding protein for murein synthesis (MipA/OmpV family)
MLRRISLCLLVVTLSTGESAYAGKLLDYIRAYDLNEYALGLSVSGSESPYVGGEYSTIAYPFLTSFRDSAFTDDWLLIREGDLGVRWVSEGGWELGAVGRIQTLGTGPNEALELDGLSDRAWTLETGPIIGWRGWPVHINFKMYTEILGRHDGLISQLAFSLPRERGRRYVIPSVELIHRSSDYTNYYFGVSPLEARPTRPEYIAGSALNTALKVRWGFELTEEWLLSGSLGIEFLDSEISNSPIVAKDELWSARLSIAYNSDIFVPRESRRGGSRQARAEFRVAAFSDSIDTKIVHEGDQAFPGSEIDLEETLGLSDKQTIMQVDAIFRIGDFHRIEIGYFDVARSGVATLQDPIISGDELFAAGTTVNSRAETKILRLSYAYSLINDVQKELGLMAGVHYSRFTTEIFAPETGQRDATDATVPLPVIGAHGSIAIGRQASLGARLQFFRMDFDRYKGLMNYASLELQRRFGETFSAGLAYNYIAMNLDSRDDDLMGAIQVRHHGPVVFVSVEF